MKDSRVVLLKVLVPGDHPVKQLFIQGQGGNGGQKPAVTCTVLQRTQIVSTSKAAQAPGTAAYLSILWRIYHLGSDRQDLALLPRLECSSTITAGCGLNLLVSSILPTLASQLTGTTYFLAPPLLVTMATQKRPLRPDSSVGAALP
ncbi:hypothetical protein AAY473_021700 [Plecturocebus cupreus]